MTTTETRSLDGIEITFETTECVNCSEVIARSDGRGMRAWRHVATFSGLCASGETCADAKRETPKV